MARYAGHLAREGRSLDCSGAFVAISDPQQVLAIFILTTVIIGGLYIAFVTGRAAFAYWQVCLFHLTSPMNIRY